MNETFSNPVELKNHKYVLINTIHQIQPVPRAGLKGFWGKFPPKFPFFCIFLFVLLLPPSVWSQGTAAFQTRQTWSFPEDGVFFSNDFSGARLNGVTRTASNTYRLEISPETAPINDSPWYAFRVWANTNQNLSLTLAYTNGTHRYIPKIQTGSSWSTLSSSNLTVNANQTEATFTQAVSSTVRTVAGQPLVTWEEQHAWANGFTNLPFVTRTEIGRSVQNRPLYRLDAVTAPTNAFGTLILMTGQHPPEFTSVTAFRNFVGEILGDSSQAREFRRRYHVVIFPLMNPDGWHHGHWRCNANGEDPNRNWSGSGPTNVPEVRAAIAALRTISNPVAFLDFHSTEINVFYTGTDDAEQPAHLVPEFLSALAAVETTYSWSRSVNDSGQGSSSRSWVAQELGCAALTWEFSDIAANQRLIDGPVKGAQELMKLMLGLWGDATNAPAARYNFENSLSLGQDSAGIRTATLTGSLAPSASAAVGSQALSLAGTTTYLSVPDWDYASGGGTLSFWFRMNTADLDTSGFSYLFSHGNLNTAHSLNIYHRDQSQGLRISVADGNDATVPQLDIPENLYLNTGRWHHLAVIVSPGIGTKFYLDGVEQASTTNGSDGLNPSGAIYFGQKNDLQNNREFQGLVDDIRFYSTPLKPYQLSQIRYPDAPAEPYLDWKETRFAAASYGAFSTSAADGADPDGDGVSNLTEFALGSDPMGISQALVPALTRNVGTGLMEYSFPRRKGTLTGTTVSGATVQSLRYQVMTSTNLIHWVTGSSELIEVGSPTSLNTEMEKVTVRAANPAPGEPKRFFRLHLDRTGN